VTGEKLSKRIKKGKKHHQNRRGTKVKWKGAVLTISQERKKNDLKRHLRLKGKGEKAVQKRGAGQGKMKKPVLVRGRKEER